MKSMLIIGLGRFGRHLAFALSELGCQVMAIDQDEALVEHVSERVESARIADCTDEAVLRSVGVKNFDCCFVCIGQDFQAAMEITAMLREQEAKRIVAKAGTARHANLLLKIGADEIVYPERDMARNSAVRFAADNSLGSYELGEEYSILETTPPDSWLDQSIAQLNVSRRFGVIVLALRRGGKVEPITSGDFVFRRGQQLLLAGEKKTLLHLSEKG